MSPTTSRSTYLVGVEVPDVNHPVVTATQEHEVLERRRTTVDPVDQMVSIAPSGWTIASLGSATPVSHNQGPANRRRDGAGAASHIERHGVA